jgi:hypothetical protein
MPNRGSIWPDHGQIQGKGRIRLGVAFTPQRGFRFYSTATFNGVGALRSRDGDVIKRVCGAMP